MTLLNYIVDIDGVVADCTHRLHHILEESPKNWEAFDSKIMSDKPITNMIWLLNCIMHDPYSFITLLTGRNVRTLDATIDWLEHWAVPFHALEMRGLHDRRPASEMKLERLTELGLSPEDVVTVFEDDPVTVSVLRHAGYHVCALPWDTYEGGCDSRLVGGRES